MAKKNECKEETLRKRMYSFADLHPSWPKNSLVRHFKDMKKPKDRPSIKFSKERQIK